MRIVPLSAFRDNYIWAFVEGTRCVVVDPGDAMPVLTFLREQSLGLAGVLLTHHHQDHIGGVEALLAQHPADVFGAADERIPGVTRIVEEGSRFGIAGFVDHFDVMEVPGHTTTHVAYLTGDNLFCGDTLFSSGCGRLLGGTAAQLFASLQRIAALPPQTRIFCTHEYTLSNLRFAVAVEPDNDAIIARQAQCTEMRHASLPTLPVTVGEELKHNPFLHCHTAGVRQAAEAFVGQHLGTPQDVFAALRKWKDDY